MGSLAQQEVARVNVKRFSKPRYDTESLGVLIQVIRHELPTYPDPLGVLCICPPEPFQFLLNFMLI